MIQNNFEDSTEGSTEHLLAADEAIFPIFPVLAESVISRISCDLSRATILDIGGGTGLWLEAFRSVGLSSGTLVDCEYESLLFAWKRWKKMSA
ncbi:MAG: hypothetical protein HQM09_23720, partial [Candidatus Riflebacteria bacterium]|nr:hypothetical protein [Candidatus Riflebacteria bacterium]